jgi:heme a synthase
MLSMFVGDGAGRRKRSRLGFRAPRAILWGVMTKGCTDVNAALPARFRPDSIIAFWLLGVAAMVFIMVVIGGLTRLTESGLSIVDWRPVTGWLPPLTEAEWLATFQAYRATPEYLHVNRGMTLAEFKGIFWLEYIHRLWGRLIGVAFIIPFMVFLAKGWIGWRLAPHLIVALVLGGLQGVLGWYMVKSGLIDRPEVSQYRLTAHLGAAILIYGYLLWLGWSLMQPQTRRGHGGEAKEWRYAVALTGLVVLTILAGGFVAGLNAGLVYNTFPLMDGRLVPDGLFQTTPFWLSLFEDVTTVQFTHRVLALTTLAAVIAFWLAALRRPLPRAARLAVHALAVVAIIQVGLGIATLLLAVPIGLGVAHQAGGVLLFTMALLTVFQLRPDARQAPAHDRLRMSGMLKAGSG